jgi:hypothetical protein
MTGQDEMARVEAPGRCTPSEGPPVERPMHPGRDEMEFELNKWSGFALVLAALLVAPVAGAQEQTESEEDTVQTITDAVAAEAVDDGGDAEAADGEPGEEDCDDDAPPPVPQERCLDTVDEDTGQPLRYAPARIDLNDEGTQWIRFITWLQIWARAQELNPGTRVDGSPQSENFDIGVRRARFLVFGQVIPRVRILFHAGMNNQSFVTGLRPDFYIHDAWTDFEVIPDGILWLGGGLHYWNGLSRHANASTLNFLGMDAPISNWFTIERTDQFARQMGLFAHGQIEGFDYRIALNRPFTPPRTLGNATWAPTAAPAASTTAATPTPSASRATSSTSSSTTRVRRSPTPSAPTSARRRSSTSAPASTGRRTRSGREHAGPGRGRPGLGVLRPVRPWASTRSSTSRPAKAAP